MSFRSLLLGAGVATALGFAAQAQTMPAPDSAAAPPAASPPADAAAAAQHGVDATAAVKPGMIVKDNAGATVGKIVQVGKTADGTAAAVISVDGKSSTVAATTLTPAGDGLVSSQTKAQIRAAAKPPG